MVNIFYNFGLVSLTIFISNFNTKNRKISKCQFMQLY